MESKAAADIPECGECGKPWTTDLGRHQRAVHRGLRECICDSCREEQIAAVAARHGLPAG